MIGKKGEDGATGQWPKIGMFLIGLFVLMIFFTRFFGDIGVRTLNAAEIYQNKPVEEFEYLDMCYDGYTTYEYKEGDKKYVEHTMLLGKIKCEYEEEERDIPEGVTPCPYNIDIGEKYTRIDFCSEGQECHREYRDQPCRQEVTT